MGDFLGKQYVDIFAAESRALNFPIEKAHPLAPASHQRHGPSPPESCSPLANPPRSNIKSLMAQTFHPTSCQPVSPGCRVKTKLIIFLSERILWERIVFYIFGHYNMIVRI